MKNIVLLIYSLFISQNAISQTNLKVKFIDKIGFIDQKYYEVSSIEAALNKDLEGRITPELNYPHAYRYLLNSDSKILFRKGFYFIDANTNSIKVDTVFNSCFKNTYSDLNYEYRYKYLPFIYRENFEKCNPIIEQLYYNYNKEDIRLNDYIKENPDSFVALWHLIERVNYHGFSEQRKVALFNFSERLKNTKIWKLLKEDLTRLEVYSLGQILPKMTLKNIELEAAAIDYTKQKSKYTLVEFWFARCKPCLVAFKKLVPLKKKYSNNDFNIIAVSTDKTDDIPLWTNTINRHNLKWDNYLDVAGNIAKEMNISSYPSNFLLDETGRIIKINISVDELELFLSGQL